MKKLLICLMFVNSLLLANGWTKTTPEQAERNLIMNQIKQIQQYYQTKKFEIAGMGGAASSAFQNQENLCQQEIFNLLKNIGSPLSYKILQELIANGSLPVNLLKKA